MEIHVSPKKDRKGHSSITIWYESDISKPKKKKRRKKK